MTFAQALEGELQALEKPIALERNHRILAARWREPAGSRGERRDAMAVQPYEPQGDVPRYCLEKRP